MQGRGDTRVGGGQALLTDLRRSGKGEGDAGRVAPHHWLLFCSGKENGAEDVLIYARLSEVHPCYDVYGFSTFLLLLYSQFYKC